MAERIPHRRRSLVIPLLAAVLVAGSLAIALVASFGGGEDPVEEPAPAVVPTPRAQAPEFELPADSPEEVPEEAPQGPGNGSEEAPAEAEVQEPPEEAGDAPPEPTRAGRAYRGRVLRRRQAAQQMEAGHPDRAINLLMSGRPDAGDRESANAVLRLKKAGTVNTYLPVRAALRWLVSHRDPKTGGLHGPTHAKVCGDKECGKEGSQAYDPGVSGLVLMALTAYKPLDLTREFENPALRLTEYLTRLVDPEGRIGPGTHYNEAIATLALQKARVWRRQPPELRQARTVAVARLANYLANPAQNADGGWRYKPNEYESDTSVTCWVLQALIEVRHGGAGRLQGDIQDGLGFLDYCTDNLGWTGYTGSRHRNPRLTAAATYVRLLAQVPPGNPRITRANKQLLTMTENLNRTQRDGGKGSRILLEKHGLMGYGSYYLLNVASRLGGEKWVAWAAFHRGAIIESQVKEGHLAGSWDPASNWGKKAGRLYFTAIQALALLADGS